MKTRIVLLAILFVSLHVNASDKISAQNSLDKKNVSISSTLIFVNAAAGGSNNGTSWTDAYTDFQVAMDAAVSGDTIWVAAGVYKPSSAPDNSVASDRDKSFHLEADIKIFGGFAGTETELSQRYLQANETTLSGDLGAAGNSDNAYHVFITADLTNAAIIDGFTIRDGNANGAGTGLPFQTYSYRRDVCGGLDNVSSSPTIRNLIIRNNYGTYGGGMYNLSASPIIINAVFWANSSTQGAGMYNNGSSATVTNATFYNNSATTANGGIYSGGSNITISNTIFWGNTQAGSSIVAGADIGGSTPTITYSLTQESSFYSSGTGIINNQDPLFTDAANGDYSLSRCSPAINAGTTVTHTTDILGNSFVGIVDIGAYEFQGMPNAIYVNVNATAGNNDGSSWANAYTALQDAIDNQCGGLDIWVATGTYLPTKDHTGNASPTDNRDKNFHFAADMKIYGGFDGTESLLSERDWAANITTLSGDFNNDDVVTGGGSTLSFTNNTENAYHVMLTANLTAAALIDGFTIKGGNANGNSSVSYQSQGFWRVQGGGMYNYESAPTITNATFTNNKATYGGGMENDSSSPTITNATFTNNKATYGGGMDNYESAPTITNATFTNNNAPSWGGGMYNSGSSPTITNSIIWDNGSSEVANFDSSTPIFKNSILKGSGGSGAWIASFGTDNGGNLDADPFFIDAANGDFSLSGCPASPAINAGTPVTHTTDILGNSFVGIVDIGAYEYQGLPFNYSNAIYVNINATGNNDGSSWSNAYTAIQDAIDNQCGGLAIWVAAGTYLPTKDHTGNSSPTDNRDKNFHFAADMKIYGGFAGTESLLSERDLAANITTLSGDFNSDDVVTGGGSTLLIAGNAENAYHVLITANLTAAALIEGFTIKGGNANDGGSFSYQSQTFYKNFGGGMYNFGSSPTITNATFTNNNATSVGGGMFNTFSSSPTITNATFTNNNANYGGGMYNSSSSSSLTITNATFTNNNAIVGGGMYNFSSTTITNATFYNNSATTANGGIYSSGSNITISNTIFWGNTQAGSSIVAGADIGGSTPTITYSLTQESSFYSSGTGIINNQDPLFVDAANGDFSLSGCPASPAINAGTPVTHTTDILGNSFVGIVDIGAYEYQGMPFNYTNAIYVNINATGNNDGSSWANAYTALQDAIDNQCGRLDIWVAAGTYLPTKDHTGNASPTDNRDKTFHLATDMKIYGGFNGTETLLSQRNSATNSTTLSGDFNNDDVVTGGGSTLSFTNNTENAYHVMLTANLSAAALIDGFTIKGGNADGAGTVNYQSQILRRNGGGGWINFGSGSGKSSAPVLKNISFYNNTASFGGAMENEGNNGGSASPLISNCSFDSNTAGNDGGAMYNNADDGQSSPIITNCSFTSNTAGNDGGAIYNYGRNGVSSPIITNCSFTSNTASDDGGVMFNNAIYGQSSPIITNCSFTSNTASDDGGVMFNDAIYGQSSPIITNCSFTSNTASDDGGAIYNYGVDGESSPTFNYCGFNSNSAGWGGAIYNYGVDGESSPTINNCSFTSNTVTGRGGALYWIGDDGDISSTLSNCTFISNGAEHLYYDDGDANEQAKFINCSFFGATTRVVRTYFDSGLTPIDFTNCVFWGNNGDIVDKRADDPFAGDVNTRVNIVNSIVEEATFTQGTFLGNNNINQDPLFVDAANGILNLKCNSPAINQGTPTGAPAEDIKGFTREGNPDMGAYEFGYVSIDSPVADGSNLNISGIPKISSDAIIENTNTILYEAANSVILSPGFMVAPTGGAATVFRAEIGGGCPI